MPNEPQPTNWTLITMEHRSPDEVMAENLASDIFARGNYKVDKAIEKQIHDAVFAFNNRYGKYPSSLLLGWGTYLVVCLNAAADRGWSVRDLPMQMTSYGGIDLLIDPSEEFKVACCLPETPWASAVQYSFNHFVTNNGGTTGTTANN